MTLDRDPRPGGTGLKKEDAMTTTVIVKANHGWPVDVTPKRPDGGEAGPTVRVAANSEQTFCVHSSQDLLIHEVQPNEIKVADDDGA